MENDGCTFWFDVWRGIDLTGCCAIHDQAFATGTSFQEYLAANLGLLICGVRGGAWDWAILAFIGVMSPIGAYLFFFGKKSPDRTQKISALRSTPLALFVRCADNQSEQQMAGPNDTLRVTNFLLDKIKGFEGPDGQPVLHVYFDPAGVPTAGWGSIKGLTKAMARAKTPITQAQAEAWLARDVDEAADAVRRRVKVPIALNQFEALVDFTFNLGEGNLASSTLLKKLNAGDYNAVPAQLLRWNKARVNGKLQVLNGLTTRRQWEAERWRATPAGRVTPSYDSTATTIPAKPDKPSLLVLIIQLVTSILSARG